MGVNSRVDFFIIECFHIDKTMSLHILVLAYSYYSSFFFYFVIFGLSKKISIVNRYCYNY